MTVKDQIIADIKERTRRIKVVTELILDGESESLAGDLWAIERMVCNITKLRKHLQYIEDQERTAAA